MAAKKKTAAAPLPGSATDFLYVMVQGKYYRLKPSEVKKHEIKREGNDVEVFDALKDLEEKNSVVADLPGPGAAVPSSCVCIALNIGFFEGSLQGKLTALKAKP